MAEKRIEFELHHGIGDALFITPSLPLFKKNYPHLPIIINTKYPSLFTDNPHVDEITRKRKGFTPIYVDPISEGFPDRHHIHAVWESICTEYGLETEKPPLQPEVFIPYQAHSEMVMQEVVGVQTLYPDKWHRKKVWSYFDELAERPGFAPVPDFNLLEWDFCEILSILSSYRGVICAEGGTAQLCKAAGVPCMVIYGGFAKPQWAGYEDHLNIVSFAECSPCYNELPCKSDHACMKKISVEQIVCEVDRCW